MVVRDSAPRTHDPAVRSTSGVVPQSLFRVVRPRRLAASVRVGAPLAREPCAANHAVAARPGAVDEVLVVTHDAAFRNWIASVAAPENFRSETTTESTPVK